MSELARLLDTGLMLLLLLRKSKTARIGHSCHTKQKQLRLLPSTGFLWHEAKTQTNGRPLEYDQTHSMFSLSFASLAYPMIMMAMTKMVTRLRKEHRPWFGAKFWGKTSAIIIKPTRAGSVRFFGAGDEVESIVSEIRFKPPPLPVR